MEFRQGQDERNTIFCEDMENGLLVSSLVGFTFARPDCGLYRGFLGPNAETYYYTYRRTPWTWVPYLPGAQEGRPVAPSYGPALIGINTNYSKRYELNYESRNIG
jgi:hypothetical protein